MWLLVLAGGVVVPAWQLDVSLRAIALLLRVNVRKLCIIFSMLVLCSVVPLFSRWTLGLATLWSVGPVAFALALPLPFLFIMRFFMRTQRQKLRQRRCHTYEHERPSLQCSHVSVERVLVFRDAMLPLGGLQYCLKEANDRLHPLRMPCPSWCFAPAFRILEMFFAPTWMQSSDKTHHQVTKSRFQYSFSWMKQMQCACWIGAYCVRECVRVRRARERERVCARCVLGVGPACGCFLSS